MGSGTSIETRLRGVWRSAPVTRLRRAGTWRLKRLATKIDPGAKRREPTATSPVTTPPPNPPRVTPVALGEPNDRRGGWLPSDPFVPFPPPAMSRHDLLRQLHAKIAPRTYLEIGVSNGQSLSLSTARSVGIDPEFQVTHALHCDLDLVRAKSDAFFARADPLAHLEGQPVDFGFIDGMHLSEFALRDFMNLERHMDRAGIVVFDDVLPRNPLEAARNRLTAGWAGDVYKAIEVLVRHRPDLLVLLINTHPTGTAIVVGADPDSPVLGDVYDSELPYLEADDPQSPPEDFMTRSAAVDPKDVLDSEAWELLARARQSGDHTLVAAAMDALRAVPRLGVTTAG